MRIAFDIGHADGTSAASNGITERSVTEPVAYLAAALAIQRGHAVRVFDSPDETNTEDLNRTIAEINDWKPDVIISIHCDSSDNVEACGGHALYYPGSVNGAKLAEILGENLADYAPGRASAVSTKNTAIMRRTLAVCVTAELDFITCKRRAAMLQQLSVQQSYAEILVGSVEEYVGCY